MPLLKNPKGQKDSGTTFTFIRTDNQDQVSLCSAPGETSIIPELNQRTPTLLLSDGQTPNLTLSLNLVQLQTLTHLSVTLKKRLSVKLARDSLLLKPERKSFFHSDYNKMYVVQKTVGLINTKVKTGLK